MKIGIAHRNKIWRALVEWRESISNAVTDASQLLQHSISSASTDTLLASQGTISQQSSFCPGYFEVTRYTFKQTISLSSSNIDGHPLLKKNSSNCSKWNGMSHHPLDLLGANPYSCYLLKCARWELYFGHLLICFIKPKDRVLLCPRVYCPHCLPDNHCNEKPSNIGGALYRKKKSNWRVALSKLD